MRQPVVKPRKIYTVTVGERGQITVPREIRRYVGLHTGQPVALEIVNDDRLGGDVLKFTRL